MSIKTVKAAGPFTDNLEDEYKQKKLTIRGLREKLKGIRRVFVMVSGTETWVKISKQELEYLRKSVGGRIEVDLDHSPDAYVFYRDDSEW